MKNQKNSANFFVPNSQQQAQMLAFLLFAEYYYVFSCSKDFKGLYLCLSKGEKN